MRLKASYVIPSSFSAEARAILTALKTYGMLLADNGSNFYMSGAPDALDFKNMRGEIHPAQLIIILRRCATSTV